MFRVCSILACILFVLPVVAGQPEIHGVARVIDGDTLEINGTRIRLGGIDAPERAEICSDARGRDWACGAWATKETRALIGRAPVSCVDLGARSFDRIVARCYLNGRDLAITLIEAGIVRPCVRFAREQGQEQRYLQAETVAIAARAGIHAGPLNPPAAFCMPGSARMQVATAQPDAGGCVIKGNVSGNGRIYHLPGQRDYDRVTMRNPETRWFCTEAEAQAAGWRRAQR